MSKSVAERKRKKFRGPARTGTTRHIFVTGGVASSLGKGLTASSLGQLLRARGLEVRMQKLDPYINVDPGNMNPFEHGEVFITEDGAEADLDIGHYERFLDIDLDAAANVTTGQVYSRVIARERAGDFDGATVQVIPHITNEIKRRMRAQAAPDVDVIITEIGGTVGDIESLPFLEAARQVRHDLGRDEVFVVHVSLIPFIGPSGELKTKPTQHSVAQLRSIGIQPDSIVCRADRDVPEGIRNKIALMCDVDRGAVVTATDAPSIYDIPKVLHDQALDAYVVRALDLPFRDVDWDDWTQLLRRVHEPKHRVEVALVGKHVDLPDAYLSVTEALRAGGFHHDTGVKIRWIAAADTDSAHKAESALAGVDAVIVPGGFGTPGVEGKIFALQWARENQIPVLGVSLGLQCMVIEYARNIAEIDAANSTEFDTKCEHPIINLPNGTKTMRLGAQDVTLEPGTLAAELYGATQISERHRNQYEVNPEYLEKLAQAGLVLSGHSTSDGLIEMVELPTEVHPFYVGTQGHPEFKSRPNRAHPLYAGLIGAALKRQTAQK
ncbi:MAG TPA: CTP synthase [Actinomycetales bacterium]|nr:CTP synthase [Actinomycetales bacterium]